jgi:D-alanyl-D-alanine carboxypeptidase
MSSLFISLLIFLEVIGFSGSQKTVENIAKSVGFSDPFNIGKIVVKDQTQENQNIFSQSSQNNQIKDELPAIAINQIKSYPKTNSKEEPKVFADAAFIYDIDSGKVLYSKNPEKIRPVASVTKVMTAIVILENKDLDEIVKVAPQAAWVTGSKMHLYPFEQIKVRELIAGMLIASANDAAKALESYFGKEDLVNLMNEKSEWLGLKATHFVEASGLDAQDHSSVKDLAILSDYALKNKIFKDLVRKREYTAVSANGKIQHLVHTTNRLLKNYPDIIGLKTGFTDEAGNCLIAAAKQKNHRIVAIVLGVPDGDLRFFEARKLLDWAFKNYRW